MAPSPAVHLQASQAEPLPSLSEGQVLDIQSVELVAGKTSVRTCFNTGLFSDVVVGRCQECGYGGRKATPLPAALHVYNHRAAECEPWVSHPFWGPGVDVNPMVLWLLVCCCSLLTTDCRCNVVTT